MKPLPIWNYVISLGLWLSLCLGTMALIVERNIRDVEKDLMQYGAAYSDHLDKELVSSETILKGFSALFGAVGTTDPATVSRYARQVIEANAQIFALEIVQTVESRQLAEFVASKRRAGIRNFTVKSFSYDADRKWQPVKEKRFYYPIVFMEPMRPGSEEVLGLDIDSVPRLQRAMNLAIQWDAPVATHPFRLVEGNLAYVVYCPIPRPAGSSTPMPSTPDPLMVAMVIDVAKLAEPVQFAARDGGSVIVHHRDFPPDDPRGHILAMAGDARSQIETHLFPAFLYQRALAAAGEPFSLLARRQVGFADLSLGLLTLMFVLTFSSSLMLVAYLRAYQQGRILQIENENRLWQLANHDGLTGLPNRMLLMDRLEQLLARMQRQGKRLALMFLDLDDFKQVNDTYGHDTGDQLLKFVAERLSAGVRMEDTVARLSGDEFVILIESVADESRLDTMRQKIRQMLHDGFLIDGQTLRVRASIGVAIYPDDGDRPEALLKRADQRMYEDKQHHDA